VGCDNTFFTRDVSHRENLPDDFVIATRELNRVLKPGGVLFLSVPFGVYRHFGVFQQFDRRLLRRAIEAFGPADAIVESYYRYSSTGWQIAKAEECDECEYVSWIAEAWQQQRWPAHLPREADLAAAARAVACVRLIKKTSSSNGR
jgi:hypothetical protein